MAEVVGVCMEQQTSVPEQSGHVLPNKTILAKNLGVKVLFQPKHEDDIEIEYAFNLPPI